MIVSPVLVSRYVANSQAKVTPVPASSGGVKSNPSPSANTTAPAPRDGKKRPTRLRVRSHSVPISGSLTASQAIANAIAAPAHAALSPTTVV